ncbi:hypothetical protein R3X26_11490 [Vibrio sp. TH_r3]|uniref:hypothetical protein n=1 Tax=Vibrio sp. TH_r3 TaxID=3082084 RepID=UPI00295336C7|nr:hypothetical protein [Vibrio sp. TH_r3]MDV7105024.1 hypothetical protein [Vibrio sp. TH_r3]
MLTKDVSTELELAMQKIHASGKNPTVALVKAQLTTSVPMPAIIAAIKSWKGNKTVPKIEIASTAEQNTEKRIEQLETQVSDLTSQLNELNQELNNLTIRFNTIEANQ